MTDTANPHELHTVRCAGPNCDEVRKKTNHWFSIMLQPDGSFVCWPFDKVALMPEMKPVCGARCAQLLFEQFLTR